MRKKIPRNTALLTNPDNSDKKMKEITTKKKKRGQEVYETKTVVFSSRDDVHEREHSGGMSDKKKKKKKKNKENTEEDGVPHDNVVGDDSNQQNDNLDSANSEKRIKKAARNKKRKGTEISEAETTEIIVSPTPDDVNKGKTSGDKKKNKLKKNKKNKQKRSVAEHVHQQVGKSELDDEAEVYEISSGDEDETTGMKRWISEYHEARPGAEVLLQNINDFLVDYWAQKEKERKERESEAAEGGWTVVTHMKGRKKTTDAESGTTVGSVAQAAVVDKMSKKKDKDVGLNFYRFQRREAQRNEIMMLQSKFEQDKKRIQQMRAARKFRPY